MRQEPLHAPPRQCVTHVAELVPVDLVKERLFREFEPATREPEGDVWDRLVLGCGAGVPVTAHGVRRGELGG